MQVIYLNLLLLIFNLILIFIDIVLFNIINSLVNKMSGRPIESYLNNASSMQSRNGINVDQWKNDPKDRTIAIDPKPLKQVTKKQVRSTRKNQTNNFRNDSGH